MLSLEGVALRAPEKKLLDSALVQLDELAAKGAADPAKANEIASEVRVKKRLLSILTKGSKSKVEEEVKTWGLNFFRSPAAFFAKEGGSKQVGSVEWDVTTLQSGQPTAANLDAADPKKATWGSGSTDSTPAASKSTATGKKVTTKTDIVVSSVGYQSEPLFSPSASTSPAVVEDGRLVQLPFDPSRRVVPNAGGRIIDPSTKNPIPNTYVSGWLARGPSGVIATTMMDAYGVADVILADLHSADQARTRGGEEGGDLLVQLQRESSNKVVGFEGWRRIDEQEKQRGQKLGKLREKILTVKEMLDIVN